MSWAGAMYTYVWMVKVRNREHACILAIKDSTGEINTWMLCYFFFFLLGIDRDSQKGISSTFAVLKVYSLTELLFCPAVPFRTQGSIIQRLWYCILTTILYSCYEQPCTRGDCVVVILCEQSNTYTLPLW